MFKVKNKNKKESYDKIFNRSEFYKQSIKILHMYIIKPYNEKRKR